MLGHRVRVNGVSLLGLQWLILGLPQENLPNTPNSLFSVCLPPIRVPNEVWLGYLEFRGPERVWAEWVQTSFGTLMGGRQALNSSPNTFF